MSFHIQSAPSAESTPAAVQSTAPKLPADAETRASASGPAAVGCSPQAYRAGNEYSHETCPGTSAQTKSPPPVDSRVPSPARSSAKATAACEDLQESEPCPSLASAHHSP